MRGPSSSLAGRIVIVSVIIIIMMSSSIKRWTVQLKAITEIIYSSDVHLTASEIYEAARKRIPSISLGTIYRDIRKLKSQGMICEVKKGDFSTYSKHPDTNAHFECEVCHRLYCIPVDLSTLDLSRMNGFQVDKCAIAMSGVCKECDEKCI